MSYTKRETYYANIVERNETELRADIISLNTVEAIISSSLERLWGPEVSVLDTMSPIELVIDRISFNAISDLNFSNINVDDWFELGIRIDVQEEDSNATLINYDNLEQNGRLLAFVAVDPSIKQSIKEKLCLDYFEDEDNQEALLSKIEDSLEHISINTNGVGFLPVGQGSSIVFINNAKEADPLAFFDVGGNLKKEVANNKITIPLKSNIEDKSIKPLVILSHWDEDHFKLATLECGKNLKKLDWIVPNQDLTIRGTDLARELVRRNNLVVWQKQWGREIGKTPAAKLIKCTGKPRNNSGLAMKGILFDNRRYLFPGDAAYKHIHGCNEHEYSLLAASHHGGKLSNWKDFPAVLKERESIIVYSYGKGHKHPFEKSIEKHASAGWGKCAGVREYKAADNRADYSFEKEKHDEYLLVSWMVKKRHDVTDDLGLFIIDSGQDKDSPHSWSRRFLSMHLIRDGFGFKHWPRSYIYSWGKCMNTT